MTMSWMVGRELSQVTKSNKTYSFKYNADGLRTEKKCETDGNTAHYYYDSNGNMIAFRRNNAAVVYFYYDSEGNVTSMSFEGTKYFFIKNIQGDVEKIVTHQGDVAVTYKYDAWGKLISKTDNTVYGIGELNPFRYRGYIYDDETGLYYLKSRYYDPITGRFLNADDTIFLGANNNSLSINIFSYCENDSINCVDHFGFAKSKIKCWFVTLEYKYIITRRGVVQFKFDKGNDYWGALWRGKSRKLAKKIYKKARKKGKEKGKTFMLGRTIGGVDVELKLHWLAYTLNIAKDHANPADIGGTDVDNTAWFFESANALSIAKNFSISNIWGIADSIRRIADYF